jgi:hypothetical protein
MMYIHSQRLFQYFVVYLIKINVIEKYLQK